MISYRYLWPALAFCISTTDARAGCEAGFDPYTICDIKGRDTVLSVCHDTNSVTYSYGAFGKVPELELHETIAEIDYFPWDGPIAMSGSVTFHNGDYAYEVVSIFEPDPFDGASSAVTHFGWIMVSRDGKLLERLECIPEPARYAYGSGIYENKVAAGFAWNSETKGWLPVAIALPD